MTNELDDCTYTASKGEFKAMEKEKTKITFKQIGEHYVAVLLNGNKVGHIYSQMDDGGKPYPHDNSEYCKTSMQICGFDKCSAIWSCGIFSGKKDLVVNYHCHGGIPMEKLKNFKEWVDHDRHPSISRLKGESKMEAEAKNNEK